MKFSIDMEILLPPARNDYAGPSVAVWFLLLVNIMGTVRSLIHMFFSDSGAQTIATMNLNVSGKQNIVGLLGQWGGAQLLMAIAIWIVLWRYRVFVPLMIGTVGIEQLIRIFIGLMKPLITSSAPPGRLGSLILLPISTLMLIISLLRTDT
jgi:hypothetical protein